ncbi:MAG: hypothetical protein WBA57_00415 [Elainellaceae cyanobacterium]
MPFFHTDETLQQAGDRILNALWSTIPGLARNQIALTWIVYDNPVPVNTGGALSPEEFWRYPVRGFSYRGVECFEPAGMVRLFYLVAAHDWLEQRMVAPSAELERAMQAMILAHSHDATSLVVDSLSGTTSGPELPSGPFVTWQSQRNIVNRYYHSLGCDEFETLNVNQKTWQDGPYGRERLFMGDMLEHRNQLTTEAIARLFHSIIGGVAVSAARSEAMMTLLRSSESTTNSEIYPPKTQHWTLSSPTPTGQVLATYVECPTMQPYLFVIATEEKIVQDALLPDLSRQILNAVRELPPSQAPESPGQ